MNIEINNNYIKRISQQTKNEIDKWSDILLSNKTKLTNDNIESIIKKYKDYIYSNFELSANKYNIYITKGSKSYNLIFKLLTLIYNKVHIIISNTEDLNILEHCNALIGTNTIEFTFLTPNKYGIIELDDIKNNIKRHTKLISMPYYNKELGTVNNLKEIENLCKSKNILLASNINFLFGYNKLTHYNNIDILFTSCEYIYGPANISLLIIKKYIIDNGSHSEKNKIITKDIYNYLISSNYIINSTTFKKNIPYISGSLHAMIYMLKKRNSDSNKAGDLKNMFLNKLNQIFPIMSYNEFNNIYYPSIIKLSIIILNSNSQTDFSNKTNTILFSIYSNKIKINNSQIKKYLTKNNIIINDIPSILVNNINYDSRIRNGLLSLSFNIHNKPSNINIIIKHLIDAIKLQYPDLYNELNDNVIAKQKLAQKKSKKVVRFSTPLCVGKNTKVHNSNHIKSILIK